jgi:hypothetical protein
MDNSKLQKALSETLAYVTKETEADRAIVAYEGFAQAVGFDLSSQKLLEEGPLSQKMLKSFLQKREAVLIKDTLADPDFESRTSAVLSSLGSVLFVPIENENKFCRGFLYLDQTGRSTFLSSGFLDRMERYVRTVLEPKLHSPREHLTWNHALNLNWLSV